MPKFLNPKVKKVFLYSILIVGILWVGWAIKTTYYIWGKFHETVIKVDETDIKPEPLRYLEEELGPKKR